MIQFSLTIDEALIIHRSLDREIRMFGAGTPNHDAAVAIAARLAAEIVRAPEVVEAPKVERVADNRIKGSGV